MSQKFSSNKQWTNNKRKTDTEFKIKYLFLVTVKSGKSFVQQTLNKHASSRTICCLEKDSLSLSINNFKKMKKNLKFIKYPGKFNGKSLKIQDNPNETLKSFKKPL